MAIANFNELCKGLCEIARLAAPDLTPDEHGSVAIEAELNDVTVIVSHGPHTGPDHALLLAIFGQLPEGRELDACRTLLDINCQVHGLGFAFARNPANGDIVLKQNYPFDRASASDLYQRITQMVEGVNGWRQHHFLVEDEGVSA